MTVSIKSFSRTCPGGRTKVTAHVHIPDGSKYGYCELSLANQKTGARVDKVPINDSDYSSFDANYTLRGPANPIGYYNYNMFVVLGGFYGNPWYVAYGRDRARFSPLIFPNLTLDRLELPRALCPGLKSEIGAIVSETSGKCSAKGHLKWLGRKTNKFSVSPGSSKKIPLEFTVPNEPADISVELVDDVRGGVAGSRLASITPKMPEINLTPFKFTKGVEVT